MRTRWRRSSQWPARSRQFRVPAAARHGRGAARDGAQGRGHALPHLCAGRRAFRPAGLSGAPAARERRQLVLRSPDHRRGCAGRGDRPRSVRDRRNARARRQSGDPETRRRFSATSRSNSRGWDITDPIVLAAIDKARAEFAGPDRWTAAPMTRAAGCRRSETGRQSGQAWRRRRHRSTKRRPRRSRRRSASRSRRSPAGRTRRSATRAAILRRAADLYEANAVEFFALATREAGKTLADGIAEVREAVDFLRYYAAEARRRRSRHRGARRHRLHLALEFSAGDLHRPDRGGPCHRQYRASPSRPSRRR